MAPRSAEVAFEGHHQIAWQFAGKPVPVAPTGPVELKQGRVFYEFADPALESRSAGQKMLLRMGSDNADVLKKKLRELRVVVTTSQDPPADAKP